MKTKLYDIITRLNPILFFILAVAVLVIMLSEVLPGLFPARDHEPQLKVIDLNDSNTTRDIPAITYTKEFGRNIKDTYVFELKSSRIIHRRSEDAMGYTNASAKYITNESLLVNLLFAKKNTRAIRLFPQDVYIRSVAYYEEGENKNRLYRDKKLGKNIYAVIAKDTNKDGVLDRKDREDLFISEYDGTHLSLLFKDILSYEQIGDDRLLITRQVKGEKEFYIYDVANDELSMLDTKMK